MPEAARGVAKSEEAFKELRIYVLVCELLAAPEIKMTLSWPDGQPMPARIRPSTAWYASQTVKAPWVLHRGRGPRANGDIGRLLAGADGTLRFQMAHTTTIDADNKERARNHAKAEAYMPKIKADTLDINVPEDENVLRDLDPN